MPNSIGIDVATCNRNVLIKKLRNKDTLVTRFTEYVEDRNFSTVWVETEETVVQLEQWLYSTGADYIGVFYKGSQS